MLLYFYLINIGLFGIYLFVKMFSKTRKRNYTYLIFIVGLAGLGYFYFIETFTHHYFPYFVYGHMTLIVVHLALNLLIRVLQKDVTQETVHDLENEIDHIKSISELLRKRYISTLELLHDGVAFKDEDNTYFGTEKFIQIIGLKNNDFIEDEFLEKIHKDDVLSYQKQIQNLSKRKPVYNTTYRVIKDDQLLWIKEVGKLIINEGKHSYISLIKPMNVTLFPESEVDVLNTLPTIQKLKVEMHKLIRSKTPYYFVLIQLTNIPKINEKYGRDIGDLFMGEYLKKLRYNFIKNDDSLFRLEGIQFVMLIKDEKKYEVLKRALTGTGDLFNFSMQFGGVEHSIYPNLGVTMSPYEGKNVDKVIEEAKLALKETLVEHSKQNYAFYK